MCKLASSAKFAVLAFLCSATLLLPTVGQCWSEPGQLRVALDSGLGVLRPQRGSTGWAAAPGFSLGVGVTELTQLMIFGQFTAIATDLADTAVPTGTYGAALSYSIDQLPIAPHIDGGVALLTMPAGESLHILPFLGLGVDVDISSLFFVGALVRYFPLYDTALLSRPGYFTVGLRIGFMAASGWAAK